MRIAIVDDLAAERALLKDRLEQQLHRRNVQADILEYESGETFLEAARKAPFTAAFLDIYMDGMTGMEAAKKLRKTNTDCLLVFTTTSTGHALEGFQVRALHYLVKPFTEADIDALTDELLARIPQPDKYMELDEINLCLVLSNLLENALEASLRTAPARRRIKLTAYLHGNSLALIQVENTYDGVIREKGGVFQSSKRKGDGVGLQSVRHIAEKSGGVSTVTYQDGVFRARVMLRG